MLAVLETHPVQYHAPVYREVVRRGVPVTVIYGSDFSVRGYRDREFGATFAWDVDLLDGYESRFLRTVADGGADHDAAVSARGMDAALADLDPSAVLVLGYSPAFHRAGWRAAWRQRRPILFRGEANDAARDRGAARRVARRASLTLAYRSVARCLFIGAEAKRHYERHGVTADRLVFSPYCVDLTAFACGEDARDEHRQQTRAALGFGTDQRVILFSGKLSRRKGVDLLVEAVAGMSEAERRRTALLLLGDGEERKALEVSTANVAGLTARFVGFQNQRQLSPYFHASDVLALPSRHSETWGLVVNEALAHGLPAVVSDRVGSHADLVIGGRTGAVARAASVASLRDALRSVDGLVGRPDVRAACRDTVAAYSIEAAAAGIAEAYRAVAATPSRVA